MTARRTGPRKRREDDPQQASAPILTINEAAEAFPGEWIFMQVMECDERGEPLAGIVLAHHPKRDGIQPAIMDVIKNPPHHPPGFITYMGPRFRTNEEWQAYVAQQQAARDPGA